MSQLADFLRKKLEEIPIGEVGKKADLAGISREQMTRWRRGRLAVNPTLSTLERLAEVLDLRIGVTEVQSGEVVAEAGAEYVGGESDHHKDLENEQDLLRERVKRLEKELGIGSDPEAAS